MGPPPGSDLRGLLRGRAGFTQAIVTTGGGEAVGFYVDGVLVGTGLSSTIHTTDSFFAIGYRNEEGFDDGQLDFEFEGAVDEVAFFERALSACEVSALSDAASNGICKA